MKYLIVLISFILLLGSCTTTKYIEIPVETVKTEYQDRILIDTLYRRDSVFIKERGDTVFLEKYKYLYRTKELRDTVNMTDTIVKIQPVEITKEVNKIYTWQIILMVLGGMAVLLCIYKLIKMIKT